MSDKPDITAAVLVIGDEILSGSTKDKNIGTIADFCTDMGIDLCEARIVSDVEEDIIAAVRALSERYTHVFSTGGIGPTHDDITADAMAKAFGVDLPINEEAKRIIAERFKHLDMSPERLRMARIPVGARMIENAVSAAPGFTIGNVHVMAGVPKIMQAMLEVLATRIEGGARMLSRSIDCGVGESVISAGLGEIQARYPDLKLGSYPQMGKQPIYTHLVVRGKDEEQLEKATNEVRQLVARLHAAHDVVI